MAVRARISKSFIYDKRRHGSLAEAEAKMRDGGEFEEKLTLINKDESNSDKIVYDYSVPYEPFLYAGDDQFMICNTSTMLDATITGVPLSKLTVEWTQLSGDPVLLDSPGTEDTLLTRDRNDSSDKRIHIKVTNNETGVVNSHYVDVYATPTEQVYPDGGNYQDSFRNSKNSSESRFDAEGPFPGVTSEGFSKIDPRRVIRWDSPEDSYGLDSIQIFENYTGSYVPIASLSSDSEEYTIPAIREVPSSYRVQFNYNLNGFSVNQLSDNSLSINNSRFALVEEAMKPVANYYKVWNPEQRQKLSKKLTEDPIQMPMYSGNYGSDSLMLRTTKSTKGVIESFAFGMSSGNFNIFSDTVRADRDIIGGG